MTSPIVTFNYAGWVQLFPNFAYISESQAQLYFGVATQLHRNDGGGPVTDAQTQTNLLNLLTAHIAQLFAPAPNGQAGRDASIVGRITNASEGSVSVATEMPMPSNPSSAWFLQTQYGALYWTASAPFRTMRYMPGLPRPMNPWPIFGNRFGSGGWWPGL